MIRNFQEKYQERIWVMLEFRSLGREPGHRHDTPRSSTRWPDAAMSARRPSRLRRLNSTDQWRLAERTGSMDTTCGSCLLAGGASGHVHAPLPAPASPNGSSMEEPDGGRALLRLLPMIPGSLPEGIPFIQLVCPPASPGLSNPRRDARLRMFQVPDVLALARGGDFVL
jgi:hypothetical protein